MDELEVAMGGAPNRRTAYRKARKPERESIEYEAGEGQEDDDEVDDEPAASADPFPRNGTKAEQERWRRRDENRKKSGTKIVADPLERAMKGQ